MPYSGPRPCTEPKAFDSLVTAGQAGGSGAASERLTRSDYQEADMWGEWNLLHGGVVPERLLAARWGRSGREGAWCPTSF